MTSKITADLITAVSEHAFMVDVPFPRVDEPVDGEVARSLDEFWRVPERAPIAAELGLPFEDWPGAVRVVEALATGASRPGDAAQWRRVACDSERLAADEPIAAAMAALLALARWCGDRGDHIVIPSDRGGADRDWGLIALPLARNLAAAGAHWAARFLSAYALDVLESMPARHERPDTLDAQRAFRALIRELDERYEEVVGEAAWALTDAVAEQPAPRGAFAALLWCAGDVAQAHALAEGRFPPSPVFVTGVLDRAMHRVPGDLLLRRAWFQAVESGAIDLSGYDLVVGPIGVGHTRDASDFELAVTMAGGVSAARVYGDVAIGHFSGGVRDDDRRALHAIVDFAQDVGLGETETFVRMASLQLVVGQEGRKARIERWRRLARLAAALTDAEQWHATADAYDRSLDVPLFYLPPDDPTTFELLERQRCASLAYWLLAARPPLPDVPAATELREREQELAEEVRGARLISQFSILPRHYQYAMSPDDSDLAAPWWDKQQALARLDSLRGDLQALYAELAGIAPGDARARIDPRAGSDELQAALVP